MKLFSISGNKAFLVAVSLQLIACTNIPSPHLQGNPSSLLQTRVAVLPACPVSGTPAQREGGVGAAVVGALVPPLIDTAVATIKATLETLAEEREEVFQGQTVGRFYSSNPQTLANTIEPYDITENPALGCVVIMQGYFSNQSSSTTFVGFSPQAARSLRSNFGIAAQPLFYFEGALIYSKDRAGFRIRTESLFYTERLMDHASKIRELAIQLTFSKPSATNAGTSFAIGEINLGFVEESLFIRDTPMNGYSSLDPTIQTSLGTGYLPLPALDEPIKTYISGAKARLSTQATLLDDTVTKVRGLGVPGSPNNSADSAAIVEFLQQDPTKLYFANLLVTTNANISTLQQEIFELQRNQDAGLIKVRNSLDELINQADNDIEKAERAVLQRVAYLDRVAELAEKETQLERQISRRNEIRSLTKRASSINTKAGQLAVDIERLQLIQPFILNVSLTEKKPENRFWSFVSSVFSGAEEGITNALQEEFDPAKIKELEEQAKTAEEERVTARDTARKDAITEVMDYRGKEIELESLTADSSALDWNTKEKELALATLEAEIACRKARALSVDPPGCSAF